MIRMQMSDEDFVEATTVSPLFVTGANSINVIEAKQLYDRGVVFIDARDTFDWEMGHIKGALSLDWVSKFTEEALRDAINRDEPVVIHCAGCGFKRQQATRNGHRSMHAP